MENKKSTEIKFMRNVKECTKADIMRNETVKSDLNIFSINGELDENKTKSKYIIDRMV